MKTVVFFLALGVFVLIGASTARADSVQITTDFCNVLAGDCSTKVTLASEMHGQAGSDDHGNWFVRCHGKLAPGAFVPTGDATLCNAGNTGSACETIFGETTDWQEVVTPSGRVSLFCRGRD